MKAGRLLRIRELTLLAAMGVFAVTVAMADNAFLDPENLLRIANSSVVLALVALGSTLVILTRNIDVSVGSMLGLCAAITGSMVTDGHPLTVVAPVVLLVGAALGLVNGLGVTVAGVPAIVMTLGTLGAYRGLTYIYTGGSSIESIPREFKTLAGTSLAGVPLFVWLTLATVAVGQLLLSRTRTGRHVYAAGDNAEGARLLGINVPLIMTAAFTLSGVLAAAAAMLFAAQIGSVNNQSGTGIEIRAIAAAVIGGVSLAGGVGSVTGAALGALFLTAITNALLFLAIPGFWSDAMIGGILLAALLVDARLRATVETRRTARAYAVGPDQLTERPASAEAVP